MGTQLNQLIELLCASLGETLQTLAALSEAELDQASEHPCAMGGSVRDLLNHNIDHEHMHAGQVYTARYNLRKMQFSQVDRLMAETLRARVALMAALIGLPDDALDAAIPEEQWTLRQMIEHTLYWERHSIDDLAQTQLRGRVPEPAGDAYREVCDPQQGPLRPANGHAPGG